MIIRVFENLLLFAVIIYSSSFVVAPQKWGVFFAVIFTAIWFYFKKNIYLIYGNK